MDRTEQTGGGQELSGNPIPSAEHLGRAGIPSQKTCPLETGGQADGACAEMRLLREERALQI